jgi:hypothetical protein
LRARVVAAGAVLVASQDVCRTWLPFAHSIFVPGLMVWPQVAHRLAYLAVMVMVSSGPGWYPCRGRGWFESADRPTRE